MGRWFEKAGRGRGGAGLIFTLALAGLLAPTATRAEYDRAKYMGPDEVRPGMKGFGRTVMSGTRIETFQVEIISVMKNAWYAGQDVILVRCAGLNLEHSGIIGGMSGSPCYIVDDAGKERMIGAVAFGWSFNKDPICGVQPITQMLPVAEVRDPKNRPTTAPAPQGASAQSGGTRGIHLGELLARAHGEPIPAESRFSLFNPQIEAYASKRPTPLATLPGRLEPLTTPIMVSGLSPRGYDRLREPFRKLGLELMASGGAGEAALADGQNVVLEPGSVLSVALMSGDLQMDGIGTCTEVVGDKALGFGHAMFGEGFVELPLATGMIHTVIPSVSRSNKLGATLRNVGTLWGDENSAVFGMVGKSPPTTRLNVTVEDVRGQQPYRYEIARSRQIAAFLITIGVGESLYAHAALPENHVLTYEVSIDFENVGTFKTRNFSSQRGTYPIEGDVLMPIFAMTNSPFGDVKVASADVKIRVEPAARLGYIQRIQLPRTHYKPGETVTARVRYMMEHQDPSFIERSYELTLPDDLPDGAYQLTVGSAMTHLSTLQMAKPHLWRAENLQEVLAALNLLASCPENKLYMHLGLQDKGVAVGREEFPHLPSYREQILNDAQRGDVSPYQESMVVAHDTDFAVDGGTSFMLTVSRKESYR